LQSVPLVDVGRIVSGATPKTDMSQYWSGTIPWVTPADLAKSDDIFFRGRCKRITEAGYQSCSTTLLPPGSILFSSRAPIGHSAIVDFPVCTNQGFKSFIPGPNLDPVFAYFAIRAITPKIISAGRGATFAEVNTDIMESVRLPYTEIGNQRRIGARLLKSHRLVRMHRCALEMSDGLLGAVFLEMFGDPVSNPNGWRMTPLGNLLDRIDSGNSPVCEGPRLTVSEWAVLGLGAITSGHFKPEENKRLPEHSNVFRHLEVKDGDLLVTRKNTIDLVAACALVRKPPPKLLIPDTVFRFVPAPRMDLDVGYAWGLLSSSRFRKVRVQSMAAGSAGSMPGISKEKFLSLEIPLPPLPLQEQFSRVIDRFEQLRRTLQEQLRQVEHLFLTLLHEAFG
jgi:type I restriction enzyme, S subunit